MNDESQTDEPQVEAEQVDESVDDTTETSDASESSPSMEMDLGSSSGAAENELPPIGELPPVEVDYDESDLNEFVGNALEPISDESPCGEDEEKASSAISQIGTSSDAIFERIHQDFGDAVREGGGMSGFSISSSGAESIEVIDQVIDCLQNHCKSLVLATNLPYLLFIQYGVPGFSAGLDIVRELVQRFGDHLHPRDKEKVLSYLRKGVYVGNDDSLTPKFKLFVYYPVTEQNQLPYALLRNSRLKSANADTEGRYSSDAAASSANFYVKLVSDLEQMLEKITETNNALREHFDDQMLELVNFQFAESIGRMCSIIKSLATEHCTGYPPLDQPDAPDAGGGSTDTGGRPQPTAAIGEIVDREQAVTLLQRIAEYFHKNERHSPVAYTLRQVVKWTKMDLPELLEELLDGEDQTLEDLSKRVGFIRRDPDSDD